MISECIMVVVGYYYISFFIYILIITKLTWH